MSEGAEPLFSTAERNQRYQAVRGDPRLYKYRRKLLEFPLILSYIQEPHKKMAISALEVLIIAAEKLPESSSNADNCELRTRFENHLNNPHWVQLPNAQAWKSKAKFGLSLQCLVKVDIPAAFGFGIWMLLMLVVVPQVPVLPPLLILVGVLAALLCKNVWSNFAYQHFKDKVKNHADEVESTGRELRAELEQEPRKQMDGLSELSSAATPTGPNADADLTRLPAAALAKVVGLFQSPKSPQDEAPLPDGAPGLRSA